MKPLSGVAVTEVCWPSPPAVGVRAAGLRAREKSGAGATLSEIVVAWVMEPEVPVRVTVAGPEAALDEAVKKRLCGLPGCTVRDDGDVVTPVGRPVTVTLTAEVKPPSTVTTTAVPAEEPPAVRLTLAGDGEMTKSGGREGVPPPEVQPPMPRQTYRPQKRIGREGTGENRRRMLGWEHMYHGDSIAIFLQ